MSLDLGVHVKILPSSSPVSKQQKPAAARVALIHIYIQRTLKAKAEYVNAHSVSYIGRSTINVSDLPPPPLHLRL
jgi:hypothetical protein